MFKVGVRLKGDEKSKWFEYDHITVGPTAIMGYENAKEYTIFPLASVDFIDVIEEDD
jgi:hypothetical protein